MFQEQDYSLNVYEAAIVSEVLLAARKGGWGVFDEPANRPTVIRVAPRDQVIEPDAYGRQFLKTLRAEQSRLARHLDGNVLAIEAHGDTETKLYGILLRDVGRSRSALTRRLPIEY